MKLTVLLLASSLLVSNLTWAKEKTDLQKAQEAVKHRNTKVLDALLTPDGTVDANSEMKPGESLLMAASKEAFWDEDADNIYGTVDVLLKHGANPNISDKWHKTPLIYAIEMTRRKTLARLIDAGANVNFEWCHIEKNGKKVEMVDPYDFAFGQIGMEMSIAGIPMGPDDAPNYGRIGWAKENLANLKTAGAVSWRESPAWQTDWQDETKKCDNYSAAQP